MSEIQYLDYDGLQRYHELIDNKKADKSQISNVLRYSEQSLTAEQKAQARTNIGAGTSSFSGSYNDLTNKPTIPSAANDGTFSVKTKVGSNNAVTVADFSANQSSADDVTLIQGTNITLTTDTTNRTVTIAATDTTYSDATTSASGLMSSADKTKLNGIATGATANIGTITGITMNGASKGSSGVIDLGTVITSLSGYATESWVSSKLNDILGIDASGVEDLISILSDSDTATGILNTISNKVDKVSGKGLSTNDYTTDEKNKLAGIATGATKVTESTVSGWGFTKNTGTVTGVKVGSSGSILNPSSGVITLPAYESGAQVHKAPTAAEVKSALGTGSGTTKFLREDGTWQTPAYITNTDNTGVKLASSISGTKKTDSTIIKASSSTGLSIVGGTDKFSIGDGTNYIEVPISISGKQASVAKLGSTTKPVYTSAAGTFAECSTYAGGTAVTLNGTSKAASTASFYAPTAAGETGQVLVSTGGVPSWITQSTITHGAVGSAILDSTKQIDALFIS